jgi:AraC-like DNA-binding protein
MTETIFAFDETNYRRCQEGFRGVENRDYYLGDYCIETGPVIDVRADKKVVGACSIVCMRAKTRQSFRRAWSHIQADGADVTILWFVKRGYLNVSHPSGISVARPGDLIVTRSNAPFEVECHPDEAGLHEALHVVIPADAVSRFLSQEVITGFCVAAVGREFRIVERLLLDIFADDGELPDHISQSLLQSVLSVLNEALRCDGIRGGGPEPLSERRLKDILRFVERHFTDVNLTIGAVASGCGISVRYVSYLLQQQGTSFAALIWNKRLEVASRWLQRSQLKDVLVAEIAYRVGFKSAPHFSRMFKRVYGMSPGEYRMKKEAVRG